MLENVATVRMFTVVAVVLGASFAIEAREVDTNSPVIESVQESYGVYHLNGEAMADGNLQVSIHNAQGMLIFASRYPVEKPDGRYVEWTYYGKVSMKRSNPIAEELAPTLEGMAFAAKDIVRMMEKGYATDSEGRVVPHDTWGCDEPARPLQCTHVGNCCDTHDACYANNNCGYWSWLGIGTWECQNCNSVALNCMLFGIGSTGHPSACCSLGNCGEERCPGIHYNDPNCITIYATAEVEGPFNQDIPPPDSGSGVPTSNWHGYTGYSIVLCSVSSTVVPCN